jgi:heme exporter protein C
MAVLAITLWKYELTSKHASMQLRALRRKLTRDEEDLPAAAPRSAAPQHL